ncbi:STE3-domain-containing protein [Peniophora sp. CONT]|nr:STE3-domain-containing protein [Peniophora sp. CONT]
MGAVDPSYPLYPVASILAAVMLLLVLLTSFIRQSWNLGVAFLCFWLFFENTTRAVTTVLWSDNTHVMLHVYCDIVSHLDLLCYVVKPMSTLIITRRLYLITSLRSIELPNPAARRRDLLIEWTLGLGVPVIVAGPLYYVVQDSRFKVFQGFGCMISPAFSACTLMLLQSWSTIPPLVSIAFYYPRVVRILYRQSKDVNNFLRSNDSVSRTNYIRILLLASIDVVLTLPVGVAYIALNILVALEPSNSMPFYPGWYHIHSVWSPKTMTYAELGARGTSSVVLQYFQHWTSPVLAFAIFGLFGVTAEARSSYRRVFCTVAGWFGSKPARHARTSSPLGSIEFGYRPEEFSPGLEIGSRPSLISCGHSIMDRGRRNHGYADEKDTGFSCSADTDNDCGDVKGPRVLDSSYTVGLA